jgi:indole-3-glycerol phosphate synthase
MAALLAQAAAAPPARGFASALRRADGLAVIAEVKRRSPSKGDLQPDLDPVELAKRYEEGGASCLSVLTDLEFFGGSAADLQAARAAVSLPVLRKDFTVSVNDVLDARIMGADCVLLIAAALNDAELGGYASIAREVGIDALFEIHDEAELDRVLACGALLVGVNQRDLVTFEVDHARAERLAGRIPGTCIKVAESGVRDAADAQRLRDAGYDAVLVGETLVRAADPALIVRQLRGVLP